MREALADIAGGPLSDWSWQKAALRSSLGGLNLRFANQHAPAAYVSSVSECSSLAAMILGFPLPPPPLLPDAISSLTNGAAKPEWLTLDDIDVPLHQRHLSHAIDEASFNLLLESAPDTRSRALALSSSLPHAGDWLNVVPSQTLGLSLQNREFRLCLDYWLGLKTSNAGTICRLCSRQADSFGDDQVGCGGNGDRIHRHDSIRDVDSALFSTHTCTLCMAYGTSQIMGEGRDKLLLSRTSIRLALSGITFTRSVLTMKTKG